MVRWLAAFDSFALAAEAAEVWTYAAAKSHLRVCMQIACEKLQVLLLAPSCSCLVCQAVLQPKAVDISLHSITTTYVVESGPFVPPGVCLQRRTYSNVNSHCKCMQVIPTSTSF